MDFSTYVSVGGFGLQSGWLVETAGSGSDCHLVRDCTCHGPEKCKVHASIRYIEKYSDVEKKHPDKCMILWGIKKKYKCQVYDCYEVSAYVWCTFMRYYQAMMIMTLLTVPQVLAMMVDLEEEPDWSMQDEPEEEDTDR